jgi:hypothetical protein
MSKADVVISAYGKPFNTAVTIASLLKHSSEHIGRIFVQSERSQPHGEVFQYFRRCFPDQEIVQYTPSVHIGYSPMSHADLNRIKEDKDFRRSLRYQLAWEDSSEDFIFISHNDCLYESDIIGEFIRVAGGGYLGVGGIGQCWNCSANYAGVCDGDRHDTFLPTYEEAIEIVKTFPGPRTAPEAIVRNAPMPFPECRLNEFACLIDLRKARPLTLPYGRSWPFGTLSMDIGLLWFKEMRLRGERFRNFWGNFRHAPFSGRGNGHEAVASSDEYERQEEGARLYLRQNYPHVFDRVDVLRTLAKTLRSLDRAA